MPYKANEARRHKIPRARYRVSNWPEYDRALQRRGSLTVWVTPEALAAWHPPKTGRRGRSRAYSDLARSEEHTSELQSRQYLVCRLLLEKKKKHVKGVYPRFLTASNADH